MVTRPIPRIARSRDAPAHTAPAIGGASTGVEVRIAPRIRVGYIMGSGDSVPEALTQIGFQPQLMSPDDLAQANLWNFDTIVVGIRASAVRPDYAANYSRLLDFVKTGGNLIVQYQTPEFDEIPFGPYPFKMGLHAEEVTEEDSKITILEPTNPVFNTPNKITAADFDGWVEERGSKFMTEWDPQYKATSSNAMIATEGSAARGGRKLKALTYGKGTFTYVGLALYQATSSWSSRSVTGCWRI